MTIIPGETSIEKPMLAGEYSTASATRTGVLQDKGPTPFQGRAFCYRKFL